MQKYVLHHLEQPVCLLVESGNARFDIDPHGARPFDSYGLK